MGRLCRRLLVYPQMRALPMGFSLALHWAQTAHMTILSRCQLAGSVHKVFDFEPTPNLAQGVGQRIYVDNAIYLSPEGGRSSAARRAAQAALESCSLPIHDIVEEVSSLTTLRLQFESDRVSMTSSRRWRLRRAVEGLLESPFVSGEQLHRSCVRPLHFRVLASSVLPGDLQIVLYLCLPL